MKSFLTKIKSLVLENPHFWAICVITLFITFIYQAWPWREWNFTDGVWKYFTWLSPLDRLALFELIHRCTGSLFLMPIIYTSVVYRWKGVSIISFLSLTYSLLVVGRWNTLESILTNSSLLLLPAAVIAVVTIEMELRRRDKRLLTEREEQRRIYLSKMHEAQENEKRRLAGELHDDTIQTLLVISKYAQILTLDDYDISEVRRNAEFIRDTALQGIEGLRRLCLDLRPSILDNLGLLPALRWLVDRVNQESEIITRITVRNGKNSRLSSQAEAIAFRIAQEALHNIKNHSQAREAVITLEFSTESLKMMIKDDGQGFVSSPKLPNMVVQGKMGLIGIQERVDSVKGTLKVYSRPSKGTSLSINIPYDLPR